MLLMKLISPKKLPRKQSEWNFGHKCYNILLKLLLRRYIPGVIDDVIIINDVEVSHILRDEWFERELKRFGIDFAPTLETAKKSSLERRKYHRSRIFSWKETMTLVCPQKRFSIIRDSGIALDSNLEGAMRVSSKRDSILAIRIKDDSVVTPSPKPKEKLPEEVPVTKERPTQETPPVEPPKKKHKIHIKDTVPPKDTTKPQTPASEQPQEQPSNTFTQHQGFEENDIF